MSGVTYSKTWSNGETLTHTDLNANFTAVNTAVGAASGIASLNSSSLAVEDPANATATKAAGKICKWGASEAFQCSALTATTVGCAAITSTSTIQGTQITSTIADGTAPLVVTSTTKVANLHAATATDLALTGMTSNIDSVNGLATLDLGSVTNGDRFLVFVSTKTVWTSNPTYTWGIVNKSDGTATIQINHNGSEAYFGQSQFAANSFGGSTCALVKVTGTGTLTMLGAYGASGGTPSTLTAEIAVVYLKKQ